jgi:hypothetical protein
MCVAAVLLSYKARYWASDYCSAFKAIGEEERAAALYAEKDWRHQYPKHLIELGKLSLKSRENALAIARAGLNSIRSDFRFVRDGEEMAFEAAIEKFGRSQSKFHTGVVVGSGQAPPATVEVLSSFAQNISPQPTFPNPNYSHHPSFSPSDFLPPSLPICPLSDHTGCIYHLVSEYPFNTPDPITWKEIGWSGARRAARSVRTCKRHVPNCVCACSRVMGIHQLIAFCSWADYGCIEPDAAAAVKNISAAGPGAIPLAGHCYVLLGANSELGSLERQRQTGSEGTSSERASEREAGGARVA